MTGMIKLPLEKCFQGLSNIVKNVPFGQTLTPTKFAGSLASKVVIDVTLRWTFHSLTVRWWEPCMEDHKLYEWRRVAKFLPSIMEHSLSITITLWRRDTNFFIRNSYKNNIEPCAWNLTTILKSMVNIIEMTHMIILMGKRIFTLTMKKIFIWARKILRKNSYMHNLDSLIISHWLHVLKPTKSGCRSKSASLMPSYLSCFSAIPTNAWL